MKQILFLILLGFIVPGSVLAAGGCGFGTRLYGDSLLAETFALSQDAGSSISNSLSITSGTSGCSNSGIVLNEKQKNYILHTYANLEEDIMKGTGPYLANLVEIMGCSPSVNPEFRQSAHTKIEGLLEQQMDQETKALKFYFQMNDELKSNPVFLNACHNS